MELSELHPLLVHFPIALGLAALLADIIGLFRRRETFKAIALFCLILAAIAAVPGLMTGRWAAKAEAGDWSLDYRHIAQLHAILAFLLTATIWAMVAFRLVRKNRFGGAWTFLYVGLAILMVVLVMATSHEGGRLVYGKEYLKWLVPW